MPTPKAGESQDEYISRCIPMVMHEGTAKDSIQAAAICHSMWDEHKKQKSIELKFEPDQPRDESGKWSETGADGAGEKREPGKGKLAAPGVKATVNKSGTDLKVNEDVVQGRIVIETAEDFDVDAVGDDDLKDYLKSDAVLEGVGPRVAGVLAGNIQDVEIGNVERGRGYIAIETTYSLETPESELEEARGDSYEAFGLTAGMLGLEKGMDKKSLDDMERAEKELEARMRKAFSTEDPGLFTACMDDPDNKKRYPDEERRARVCASVHKKITGVYPAEHESKSLKQRLLSAIESIFGSPQESRSAFDAGAISAVFKQADGRWRWVSFSSNSFEDGDREIVSQKALDDDVRHSDATGDYGPLLWWHIPGAELGPCDFRGMHGKMLVESGMFHLEAVGQKMAKAAPKLKMSLGFFHPLAEPDGDHVFSTIRTFERSLLPATKAANQLTALPVITRKESSMDAKKLDALKELLGDDLAAQVVKQADEQEKAAQDAGIRFKEDQKTTKQDMMEEPESSAEETAGETAGGTPTTDEVVQIVTDAVTPVAEAVMSVADAVEIVASEVGVEEEVTSVIESTMTEEAKTARNKRREERYAARGKALGKLVEATKRLEAAEKEIKRLTGNLPRAIKTGFRASVSDETVIDDEKMKEKDIKGIEGPEAAAFKEFFQGVVQGQRQ